MAKCRADKNIAEEVLDFFTSIPLKILQTFIYGGIVLETYNLIDIPWYHYVGAITVSLGIALFYMGLTKLIED